MKMDPQTVASGSSMSGTPASLVSGVGHELP